MKNYKFNIGGYDYDVLVKDIEDNVAEVEVNGTSYEVIIQKDVKTPKTPRLVRKPVEKLPGENFVTMKPAQGRFKVVSPLPGIILRLNVKVGDIVTEGQNVLVMETMKMENQVQSYGSGQVTAIKVKEGDSVQQDDVLIELG